MQDWTQHYTKGPCKECGVRFEDRRCVRGICLLCRIPKDRRELVECGVPRGSADALAGLLMRCDGEAEKILGLVHPRLMQNIRIVGKALRVRDKRYRWMRRNDWMKTAH